MSKRNLELAERITFKGPHTLNVVKGDDGNMWIFCTDPGCAGSLCFTDRETIDVDDLTAIQKRHRAAPALDIR